MTGPEISGDHCESCGSTSPEDLTTGDGYTSCCNELICHGGADSVYGTPEKNVQACCWAVAEKRGVTEGSRIR